ncbi:MAG: HAMP domain-containing sensor histidine kinase [Nitriliruptoraceae bacterium]
MSSDAQPLRPAVGVRGMRRLAAGVATHETRVAHIGRTNVGTRETVLTGPFVAATTALVMFSLIATLVPLSRPSTAIDPVGIHAALQATGAVLAVLCGFVLALHARVHGSTASAWVSAAFGGLGLFTLGLGAVGPVVDPRTLRVDPIAWLQPGGRTGVLLLLVIALWTSRRESSWRRRPSRVLLVAVATIAPATVLFQVSPVLGRPFASVHDVAYGFVAIRPQGVGALLPLLWVALGIAYVSAASRRRDASLAWTALAFLGFGVAEFGHRAMAESGMFVSVGASVVQAAGLACALVGVTRHLIVAIGERQGALTSRAEAAEATALVTRRLQHERMHEARNALSGIVNTLRMLDEHPDRISEAQQRRLLAASFDELVRLQHLFAPDASSTAAAFDVADTLRPVVIAAHASGLDLEVDLPSGLVGWGSWASTTQAVQNLLENVRRHAPGSTSSLTARRRGADVEIRVADRGAGVRPEDRERIFTAGERGTDAGATPGSGLGLSITADLMRRQGGDVRLESGRDGGATFVLTLPAPAADGRQCEPEQLSMPASVA